MTLQEIPPFIRDRFLSAAVSIRRIEAAVRQGRVLDDRFHGAGRYTHEVHQVTWVQNEISSVRAFWLDFKARAVAAGQDPKALFMEALRITPGR
jgi:hypothetical protein